MKKSVFICVSILIILILNSCKKDINNDNDPTVTIPAVTTANVSGITSAGAQSGGEISSAGGGTLTAKGVCWGTNPTPTTADNKTADTSSANTFISHITGLTPNTTYYVRAYATNSAGTGYGSEKTFTTTAPPAPISDSDGNTYPVVEIGSQVWMAANLRTTTYNNGSTIPLVTDMNSWTYTTDGAYCSYDNNAAYVSVYGYLYNWYAASDSRNLCPQGWHVPTDNDFMELRDYLGGTAAAGGKLKEAGTVHWNSPNLGATNETGFTGLPGGERTALGTYDSMQETGLFWLSTESDATGGYKFGLSYSHTMASGGTVMKGAGFSIRCIKD